MRIFAVIFIALTVLASGCLGFLTDEIGDEDFSYTAPISFSLNESYSSESGNNYTFVGSLNTAVIDVSYISNSTRQEFVSTTPLVMQLSSGDPDAEVKNRTIDGRKWKIMNGTVQKEGVKAEIFMFATYHDNRIYHFDLWQFNWSEEPDYSVEHYKEFRSSVLSTEFR